MNTRRTPARSLEENEVSEEIPRQVEEVEHVVELNNWYESPHYVRKKREKGSCNL